jgi:transketolase
LDAVRSALRGFAEHQTSPTLIIVRSHIGYGAPNKQDTADAHGSPLGADEVRRTKAVYGWPEDTQFLVPQEVREQFSRGIGRRGARLYEAWHAEWTDFAREQPALAEQIQQMQARELPQGWDHDLPVFPADPKGTASRNSAGKALNAVAQHVPWLVGGSADLAPSTKTLLIFAGAGHFQPDDHGGRNFHFGVREHAMGAIVNGMTLSSLRAYAATFFVFSDYLRPTMRLAALMDLPSIFVFTHDSIGVGEDGPTHQPIEHLAAVRAIPGLVVIRPADANEASYAWRTIMQFRDRPAALVLTRQDLPTLDRTVFAAASGLARGAYVLADPPDAKPQVILIGTGSEVSICVEAQRRLRERSIAARVVSMPSWELFEEQDEEYRETVLPRRLAARVAVEAGVRQGWERYLGERGRFVGLDRYGASAPYERVYKELGISAERVVDEAAALLCV